MNPIKIEVVSKRYYGEPSLKKPSILKGLKPSGSLVFIPKKCTCPFFIKDDDVYIKHRDWCSPSCRLPDKLSGAPLTKVCDHLGIKNKSEKFCYPDCWGDVVLRNEAWIVIRHAISYDVRALPFDPEYMHTFGFDCVRALADVLGVDWTELDLRWERFFDDLDRQIHNK